MPSKLDFLNALEAAKPATDARASTILTPAAGWVFEKERPAPGRQDPQRPGKELVYRHPSLGGIAIYVTETKSLEDGWGFQHAYGIA